MNSLLSICIPTYNRAIYLSQCLDILLPQTSENDVAVYILDNASTDNSTDVVALYQSKFPNVFYNKQKVNVGLDLNMLDVIGMSSSEYCWWLGDDDIVADNAIRSILNFLSVNNVDFLLLNASAISNDLKVKSRFPIIDIRENQRYSDCVSFFRDHVEDMPFGNLVVSRAKILQQVDAHRYIGTSHAYSGVILDYLSSGSCHVVVYAKSLVYLRESVKTWASYSFDVYFTHIPAWIRHLRIIYQHEAEIFLIKYSQRITSYVNLLTLRRSGVLNYSKISLLNPDVFSVKRIYRIKIIVTMPKFVSVLGLKFITLWRKFKKLGSLLCRMH